MQDNTGTNNLVDIDH